MTIPVMNVYYLKKELVNIRDGYQGEYDAKRSLAGIINHEGNIKYVDELVSLRELILLLDALLDDKKSLEKIIKKRISRVELCYLERIGENGGTKQQVLHIEHAGYPSVLLYDTDDWDHEWSYTFDRRLESVTEMRARFKKENGI